MMHILKQFYLITGQAISYNKSSCLFSKKVQNRHRRMLWKILNMKKKMQGIQKYLGTLLFLGKSNTHMFDELVTRVASRIEGWKAKLLSQTDRTTFIKSITSAIPSYQMDVFSIPKTITDKLNAIQRDFWWGKKKSCKKSSTS